MDKINKPNYYYNFGKATVGPLDFAEMHELSISQHAIIKYVTRAGKKPGSPYLQDLKKAQFYLNRLIEAREQDEKRAGNAELAPSCVRCDYPLGEADGSFGGVCDKCIRSAQAVSDTLSRATDAINYGPTSPARKRS